MYNLKKRAFFETLGELRMLLADMPDDTEVCICGSDSCYIHFSKEKTLISFDYDDLSEPYCYEEFANDDDGELYEKKQIDEDSAHDRRIEWLEKGTKYLVVGNKVLRTFLADDGSWDYALYDISLSVQDSGQLGANTNMTLNEAISTVLSWNNLNKKPQYHFLPPPEIADVFQEGLESLSA